MSYAFDIPGYVQGFRFTDDPRFFDSEAGYFYDLAGYDHFGNGCRVETGTPTFDDVNGHRALLIDASCQLSFLPAIPWGGSLLIAAKPTFASSGTITKFLLLFSGISSSTSNGRVQFQHSSGNRLFAYVIPGTLNLSVSKPNDDAQVAAFATDQSTRTMYSTVDGVSVATSGPDNTQPGNGNPMAPAVASGDVQMRVRFGDLLGDGTTTPQTDLYCHVWELHFWKGNILAGHLAETKAFIDRLKARYQA